LRIRTNNIPISNDSYICRILDGYLNEGAQPRTFCIPYDWHALDLGQKEVNGYLLLQIGNLRWLRCPLPKNQLI